MASHTSAGANDPAQSPEPDQLLTELESVRKKVSQLKATLNTDRDIGAAIGILMANEKLTQQQALDKLRATVRQLGRELPDVAAEVMATGQLPHEPTNGAA